jgi:predicted nucleic-acid-binding Zn-ribbon protein
MALKSSCPKCESSSFEMSETPVSGSNFRLMFVRCSKCGCVVGVQDYFNSPHLIYKLAEKLNVNLD